MISTEFRFTHRIAVILVVPLLVAVVGLLPSRSNAAPSEADAVTAPDASWEALRERGKGAPGVRAQAALQRAASSCSYDAVEEVVDVQVQGYSETLEEHAVRVGPGGVILFGGAPCGAATVNNTDDIVVTGTSGEDDVVIDLRGGPFEPGTTPESSGISEIEFTVDLMGSPTIDFIGLVGTLGPDRFVLGREGVNLNGDGDADLRMLNKGTLVPVALTLGGNDVISARGGSGTGGSLRQFLMVDAGRGNDRIVGGARWSFQLGGGGNDTLIGGPKADELVGGRGDDRVRGLGGRDLIYPGAGNDRLIGGAGGDYIYGGGGADLLRGGPGDDLLNGGPGVDTCRPGPGRDTLVRCER